MGGWVRWLADWFVVIGCHVIVFDLVVSAIMLVWEHCPHLLPVSHGHPNPLHTHTGHLILQMAGIVVVDAVDADKVDNN